MTFDFTPTDDGLRIHDQIENVWTDIDAGGRVEPEPAETDGFCVPVDDAVRFEAAELEFSNGFLARVYDEHHQARGVYKESGRVARADFHEINCSPSGLKAYVQVSDTGITIDLDQTTTFSFDHETSVLFGVRSYHERPADVVSTTAAPTDLMQAISTFGTGMKTYSPERSFPTLRGHPPELAVKSSLQIPDAVKPPETGIEVGIPATLESIFTVAPLAYYLGATVVEDSNPAIVAAGERFNLDQPDLTTGVKRTLQHCFTLDCLVRTAGLYPVELQELEAVRKHVEIDTKALYDQPLDERTASYLTYPFEVFEELLPWPTVTDITPRTQHAELLPYLSYRLSAIRSPPSPHSRDTIAHGQTLPSEGSPYSVPHETNGELPVVTPEAFDTHHSGWLGDAVPRSGTVPILASYISSLDETPRTGTIDVHVVCIDDSMEPEVESLYAGRANQPLDVSVSMSVSTDELRTILGSDIDFFHFVGHTAATGLRCTDGFLDLATLPPGRYPAFFLNGCQSYYQGRELVKKGSVGGLVSFEPIENEAAIPAGRLIADLLAFGCTFSQTLAGLQRWSTLEYTAIGDGGYRLCASEDYTPIVTEISNLPEADGSISISTELLGEVGTELGMLASPAYIENPDYVLRPEYTTELLIDDLSEDFQDHYPYVIDDELYWSSELDKARLRELLDETQ